MTDIYMELNLNNVLVISSRFGGYFIVIFFFNMMRLHANDFVDLIHMID